ncbi:MAG: tyrosine-protein kinase Etk/Wzc, partial [Gammaproteobacteria bacterium]
MTGAPNEVHMYQPSSGIEEEDIDIGKLIGVLVENRWLIVAITAAALLVGLFHAYTAVPIYQADGLLQVEEKSPGLANLDATAMLGDYAPVNAEIEILRSRSVLGTVVDNLQLDINARPDYMPVIGEALARGLPADERPAIKVDTLELPDAMRGQSMKLIASGADKFVLYDANESFLLRGKVGETAIVELPGEGSLRLFVSALQAQRDQSFWIRRGSRLNTTRSLQGRLDVAERGDWSGILAISVQGPDPVSITKQVNEIANVYVRQNVERKSAEAAKTLDFLDSQLPLVRQNVEAAELALNSYRLEKGSIDLPAETQGVLQAIVTAEAQINVLRQEREKVRLAFTEIHPTIVAVDRQINRLNTELNELNDQVRDLPTTQQDLLRLIRDVEVSTSLYRSLLDTAQELRVMKAGTVGNVRVIDYAYLPTSPIKPSRSRIVLLALILGGFVGVAAAFAKKALKAGVEDPDIIEKHVNIPVYATISHSRQQDKIYKALKSKKADHAILATSVPDDAAIESLRNLRTALHFGMMNVQNNCIMIAGPSPGVG